MENYLKDETRCRYFSIRNGRHLVFECYVLVFNLLLLFDYFLFLYHLLSSLKRRISWDRTVLSDESGAEVFNLLVFGILLTYS